MNLIKAATFTVTLALVALCTGATTSAHATGSTPPPPIIIVYRDGYRYTYVCNPGCVLQDVYWTGQSANRLQ